MLTRRNMDFRNKVFAASFLILIVFFLSGCVSYQLSKYQEGVEIEYPLDQLQEGETSLTEVLALLGAPDNVAKVGLENLIIYERAVLYRNRLKVGFPLPTNTVIRSSFDITGYGTLVRYDSLALFFNTQGILTHSSFVKGSDHPYFRTLFSD